MHTTTNRLPYLDYARVFVAYLVILGHLLLNDDTIIRQNIYSFHMPFFFLVSGMLHKDMGCIAWKKYIKTLVIPFLFFNLIFFILWPIFSNIGIWEGKFDMENGVFGCYWNYFINTITNVYKGKAFPDGPSWFLLALFWCKLFVDSTIHRRWITPIALCVVFGASIVVFNSRTSFRIGNAFMVMPFFYGGFYYKKTIQQWCEKHWALLAGIGLVLLNIPLTLINGRVSTDAVWFGQLHAPINVVVFYVNAFATSLGLLAIFMKFKSRSYITTSAKALISILCIQNLFVYTFRNHCDQTNLLLDIIVSVVIFVLCVLIHQLLDRYLPFAVGKYKK